MKPLATAPTSPIQDYLEKLRQEFATAKDGEVATYNPAG